MAHFMDFNFCAICEIFNTNSTAQQKFEYIANHAERLEVRYYSDHHKHSLLCNVNSIVRKSDEYSTEEKKVFHDSVIEMIEILDAEYQAAKAEFEAAQKEKEAEKKAKEEAEAKRQAEFEKTMTTQDIIFACAIIHERKIKKDATESDIKEQFWHIRKFDGQQNNGPDLRTEHTLRCIKAVQKMM
jgi:hypothetical protein